jgi:hypothetical protein
MGAKQAAGVKHTAKGTAFTASRLEHSAPEQDLKLIVQDKDCIMSPDVQSCTLSSADLVLENVSVGSITWAALMHWNGGLPPFSLNPNQLTRRLQAQHSEVGREMLR